MKKQASGQEHGLNVFSLSSNGTEKKKKKKNEGFLVVIFTKSILRQVPRRKLKLFFHILKYM